MKPTIVARECKFAIHIPERYNVRPDLHLIKEQQHWSDGSITPNVRLVKDFRRKFWVTNKSKRSHTQKKEWEHLDNLVEYECTESQLRDHVAKALELTYTNDHLKKLAASPYVYGIDISSASLIRHNYMQKYPDHISPYNIASFDIETKLVNGVTIVKMATIAFRNRVYTGVLRDLVSGIGDLKMSLRAAMHRYLPQYRDRLEDEVEVFDSEVELIRHVFAKAHQWSPDILAIWNMDYDIPKVLEMLERHRVKATDVLCDPNVPEVARICKYKEGRKKKVTASGKVTPISPAARWHTFILTAGFYVLDAMCVYKQLRLSKAEEPSYALDAILNKELSSRKLTFEQADEYSGLRWHDFMQENYPVEYIVYNRYDCLSMLELDDKTKDLSFTVPEFAGVTEFQKFNSQPKRIADALHFYCMDRSFVLGSVGYSDDEDEEEDEGLGLKGWIVTLPAELQVHGLPVIAGNQNISTNIRCMVYDSDAVAAYPTAITSLSVSKETTRRELINVKGVSEDVFRMQNINLMSGPVNALEYGITMFKLPKPQEALELYLANKH